MTVVGWLFSICCIGSSSHACSVFNLSRQDYLITYINSLVKCKYGMLIHRKPDGAESFHCYIAPASKKKPSTMKL
uniref:Secreted protein n=1 Tax=Setaria viridis TaxID=4556 RepID=A0A4U6UC73_SETVI|nr:hypothetical protein SEVIR_6G247225v2 [Setaria viridis]